MTNQKALATEIASLDAKIKADSQRLAALKADLITLVGDGGEKIVTPIGTVTVTRRTEDRPTGLFSYSLNVNGFAAQDEHVQSNLIKQGVVNKTEKVISGQAPTVKVTK